VDEKKLIKACQKGEKQAFEELIRLFYPYVSKFLLKTTQDENISEDLTQETFLKMIRGIEKYDINGSAGFGTWLISIARNCYIDNLRKNRQVFENFDELEISSLTDVTEEAMQKLYYEKALKNIKLLPDEQGIAIRLKYEQELTLGEIADRFGVPAKTIKSRIHEGTKKLRRLFNNNEGNEK